MLMNTQDVKLQGGCWKAGQKALNCVEIMSTVRSWLSTGYELAYDT